MMSKILSISKVNTLGFPLHHFYCQKNPFETHFMAVMIFIFPFTMNIIFDGTLTLSVRSHLWSIVYVAGKGLMGYIPV